MDTEQLKKSKLTYNLFEDQIITQSNALKNLWSYYNKSTDFKEKSKILLRIEVVSKQKIGISLLDRPRGDSYLLTKSDYEEFIENYDKPQNLEIIRSSL